MKKEYVDPTSGLRFEAPDGRLPPGAQAVDKPANAHGSYGPAGPAKDADRLFQDYQALPEQERQRFWLYLNDGEQDFSLAHLQRLKRRLDAEKVDYTDREAYERAFERIENELTIDDSGSERTGRDTQDEAPAEGTRRRARGKILGSRKSGGQGQ